MDVVEALTRLGGVGDAAELSALTSRSRVRTALQRGDVVRDARGHYALPVADQALRAAAALSGVVSHLSAAHRWGWRTKHPPERPQVVVPRSRKVRQSQREGVELRWRDLGPGEVEGGVTTKVRTVLDCARDMPFDQALAVADSALRAGDVTRAEVRAAAESVRSNGRRECLRVAREADGRAANPFESVLRAISLDVPGLRLTAQGAIVDGSFLVHPDLVDHRLRLAVEADSFAWHGDRQALRDDCERYNSLVRRGWTVLRFSWEHVMFDPSYVAGVLSDVAVRGPLRPATPTSPRRKAR